MTLTDAQAYAIKVYYDSNNDVAKQAAENDDADYRFVIEDTGDSAWAVIESKKIEILEEMLKDLKR